jgi:hypothetical protein
MRQEEAALETAPKTSSRKVCPEKGSVKRPNSLEENQICESFEGGFLCSFN